MIAFCMVAGAQPIANSNKVFQIGVFDRSATEFHGGRPEHPVNFVVGQSDPAKDWYADQPSLPAAHAQDQTDLRTIQFSLSSAPAAVYRLHIALVLPGRAVPALLVSINGKSGTFYLQSKLNSTLGGMDDAFETAYVPADVSFDFPGTYLHQGSNTIGFQAIETGEPTGLPGGLNYDAIELDSGKDSRSAAMPEAKIVPTVFYQQHDGHLSEIVDVFIRHSTPAKSGSSVDLVVGSDHYSQAFDTDEDFGEEKLEFTVPEFPAKTQARVVLDDRREAAERGTGA